MSNKDFFHDVINLMPIGSLCIFASLLDDFEIELSGINFEKNDDVYSFILTEENKQKLLISHENLEFEDVLYYVEIKNQNKTLFRGFDGMVIGSISNQMKIPDEFRKNYVETEHCGISKEF